MNEFCSLKIVSEDGTPWKTKIVDDQGRPLTNVSNIKVEVDYASGSNKVEITLLQIPTELVVGKSGKRGLKMVKQQYFCSKDPEPAD
jgi:hypothetical protein